jgi:hypothetical protein
VSEALSSGRAARPTTATSASPGAASAAPARQKIILAGLVVVLALLVIFVVLPAISGGGASGGRPGGRSGGASRGQPAAATGNAGAVTTGVVDVRLERLTTERLDPLEGGRNPFRMGAAPAPTRGQAAAGPAEPSGPIGPPAPVGPPPPPAVPPIPLKFIGIVTRPAPAGKIAVLSDGRNVFSGEEGKSVDGRYRIVRIGEESVQIEHLDGRGRQTIRLTGQ